MNQGVSIEKLIIIALIQFILLNNIINIPVESSETVATLVEDKDSLIRLHVLANSDSEADQALKYKVKDEIVKQFGPRLAKNENIEETRLYLNEHLPEIEKVAKEKLVSLGSNLDVRTEIGNFDFPTKYYGDFSLPAGEYEALRVVIGDGVGANWWCVLFPPMCFVPQEESSQIKNGALSVSDSNEIENESNGTENKIVVKFKLLEWIQSAFS